MVNYRLRAMDIMKCLFLMIILGFHIEMFLHISIFLYIYIKKAKACLGTKTLFLIMKSTSLKGPLRSMTIIEKQGIKVSL